MIKVLLSIFTRTQSTPLELWRRCRTNFISQHNHDNLYGDFCRHSSEILKKSAQPCHTVLGVRHPGSCPFPIQFFGFDRRPLDLRRRIARAVWINIGLKIVERLLFFSVHKAKLRGALVAQWWEHSPPTIVVRVEILASTPYVGWVCCWFSPLLREVFLRVLRFFPLLKNRHFQIPIQPGIK